MSRASAGSTRAARADVKTARTAATVGATCAPRTTSSSPRRVTTLSNAIGICGSCSRGMIVKATDFTALSKALDDALGKWSITVMTMIELVHLTKRYGTTLAVDDLSLRVAAGEIFGFLGPNGAGKTTTIRMMMGLMQPTAGRVVLGGHDLAADDIAAKRLCGFVPDRPHIYETLTGAEFLDFVAGLYHVSVSVAAPRRDQLLQMFDLTQWATELVESYSHGMKQRLV